MKTKVKFSWVFAILLILGSCSGSDDSMGEVTVLPDPDPVFVFPKSETFTFSSNGTDIIGKIYLPDSYDTNNSLPTIYLLDYKEGANYQIAMDEAEQVIKGVQKISGLDALLVTLDAHIDVDDNLPETFRKHYEVFKNMTRYVDANYTNNTSRTFIARGREAGVVLLTLLSEDQESSVFNNFIATDSPTYFNDAVIDLIEDNKIPEDLKDKKLHFSFSSTNNRDKCLELINSFKVRNYHWLKFKSEQYNTSYETTYPTSFAEGLKFVFEE